MITTLALVACGRGQTAEPAATTPGPAEPTSGALSATTDESSAGETNEFELRDSNTAGDAHGATESKIEPTATEAAMKFVVVDKASGPIEGVVISLTAPDGKTYYTEETDAEGYAEVLVPVGQRYELVYLSLAHRDVAATVSVTDEPNQNIKLTLRYKRRDEAPPVRARAGAAAEPDAAPRFVLKGVHFDTGKATIRADSYPRLDSVVEYMAHKQGARIQISGHSDSMGDPETNKALSEKRAQACRNYLISKGIEGARVVAVGYGDERPIASNDTEEGRQMNRRIEAAEL